ncbi:hypothetical protein EPN95_02380 [Patescibacteria group bacterium]|nr:MAG: hypothetical protein EPN95_02380 [Patescibacteria group bacterium]
MAKFASGANGTKRKITKEQFTLELKKIGIAFGWALISIVFVGPLLFIAINLAGLSFWFFVGFGALFIIVAIIAAIYWASTDKTGNLAGPIIAYTTVALLVTGLIVLFATKTFDTINVGILLWGMLDFAVLVGWTAMLYLYGHLAKKIIY